MSNSIAIDALYAERNYLRSLIESLLAPDIIGKISLEARLKDVESQIDKIEKIPGKPAETVLFLGGESVNGSIGINVDFASDVLKSYQLIISSIYAVRGNGKIISENGPIPNLESSMLQLSATPRGSFGFVLQEKVDQLWMTKTSLYESVEEANELIAASALETEEKFEIILDSIQSRVRKELNNFLGVLNKYKASIRLVSSRTKIDIPNDKICLASSRIENIEIKEIDEIKKGVFGGARKYSRDFNFYPDNEDPISGKLGDEILDDTVSIMNTEYQDRRCAASLIRRETKKNESGRVTMRWTMVDIYLEDTVNGK